MPGAALAERVCPRGRQLALTAMLLVRAVASAAVQLVVAAVAGLDAESRLLAAELRAVTTVRHVAATKLPTSKRVLP